MLISIIVPIYNTERYIEDCIKSVLAQTYTNWELLLVDDGSSDRSVEICKKYHEKNENVKLILSEHKGSFVARKMGLELARGDYCIFVDSDDVIAPELLETVVPLIWNQKLDILNYRMDIIKNGIEKKMEYGLPEGIYEGEKLKKIYQRMMFDFSVSCPGISPSLCTVVAKKELLEKAMKKIDERITFGDDAAVVYTMLLFASKIAIINKPLYHYHIHKVSLTSKEDIDVFSKIKYFQENMETIFSEFSVDYELNRQLKIYIVYLLQVGIKNNFGINIRQKYELPFELLELKSKVVIYGAGAVGRSYYRQLVKNSNVEVVAWIDKNLEGKEVFACKISGPTEVLNIEFDQMLIAIKDFNTAKSIKEKLASLIPEGKIIWKRPKEFCWEQEIDI